MLGLSLRFEVRVKFRYVWDFRVNLYCLPMTVNFVSGFVSGFVSVFVSVFVSGFVSCRLSAIPNSAQFLYLYIS